MVSFRFAKVTGGFYGQAFVDLIAPINDIINRIDQQMLWNRAVAIDPIMINPVTSGVSDDELAGRLGRTVNPINAAESPFFMKGVPLAMEVHQERAERLGDLKSLGASDPSGGQLPQGRTPALAISIAMEQFTKKYSQFFKCMQRELKKLMREEIKLVRENMNEERGFSLMPDEEEYDTTVFFSGGDLAGDNRFKDDGGVSVDLSIDDMFPQSRATERQFLVEAMQQGFLMPQDPLVSQKMFEILGGRMEDFNKGNNIDLNKAERENTLMEQGNNINKMYAEQYQALSPNGLFPGENVMLHLIKHKELIQSERFEKLDPQTQQIILMHFTATQGAYEEQRQAQMEEQAQVAESQKGAPAQQ